MTSCWEGITQEQHDQLAVYRDLILDSNRKFNLTALRDAESIDCRLIAESLRLLPFLPPDPIVASTDALELDSVKSPSSPRIGRDSPSGRRGHGGWLRGLGDGEGGNASTNPIFGIERVQSEGYPHGHRQIRAVDIGTGSGIPGIPLAIARPDIAFTLIEATGKKVRFLELVATELDLANVTPLHERAEIAAHDPIHREQNDLVVARAVTQLAALAELTLPFLRVGGRALLPKGEQIDDELNRASAAIETVGGMLISAELLSQVSCCGVTRLVIVDKIESSLVRYPRRPGIPEHDPLGG